MNRRLNQKSPTVKQKVKEYCSQSADIHIVLNKLPRSVVLVYHKLTTLYSHNSSLNPSQEKLAFLTGYCRQTVNAAIRTLSDLGLLRVVGRYYQTSYYSIPEHAVKNQGIIAVFFKNFFLFSMLTLSSKVRSSADTTLYYYNDLYLLKVQVQAPPLDSGFYFSPSMWPYRMDYENDPNPQRTAQEFESLFSTSKQNGLTKKEEPMIFDEAQLREIATHPKELYSYALKMVTRDVAAGKEIADQAKYFMSILRRQAEKNKIPETGKSKRSRPSSGPLSQWKKEPPKHSETPQDTLESYKEKMPVDNIFAKIALRGIELRAKSEEATREDLSHVPESVCEDPSRTSIEWNDRVLTTDNKPIMSKQTPTVYDLSTLDHISEPLDILNEDLFEEVY